MVVVGTAGIEPRAAGRARGTAVHIVGNGQLLTASPAEDSVGVPLGDRPHCHRVIRAFGVAFVTRVPLITAVETDGDDVVFAMPVSAASKAVHIDAVDGLAVDGFHNASDAHNLGTKMAMTIVIGMLSDGFSCGVDFSI